jgi:hypothetical protein
MAKCEKKMAKWTFFEPKEGVARGEIWEIMAKLGYIYDILRISSNGSVMSGVEEEKNELLSKNWGRMSSELDNNKGSIIKLIVILDLSDNFCIWYSNIEKNLVM